MNFLQIFLWFCITLLFYSYIGYGLLLFIYNKVKNSLVSIKKREDFELLPVTLIVAAYNEESVLLQKLNNSLEIDYPADLLNIFFITDGSTDRSPELITDHRRITLLHQSTREGKSAAIKRAMRFVKTPIVVFSDANSMLNPGCLKAMIRHYADDKIGGVAGEKRILQTKYSSAVGEAEGLYWRYESFMKQQDADFNTVVGAAGELFSIRTELFNPVDDNFILDDLYFSLQVCLKGYKLEYEPGAFAIETSSATLMEEEKRKVRIATGAYQSVSCLMSCLNIFKFPLLSIQYFSRRILRWIASPLLLFLTLVINIELAIDHQGIIFYYLLIIQAIFYLLALAGRIFISTGWRMGILNIPFYFVFTNICLVKGFFRYLQGQETVLWEKSIREAVE